MRFTFDPGKDIANIAKHGLLRAANTVRAISLRRASKHEKNLYASWQKIR